MPLNFAMKKLVRGTKTILDYTKENSKTCQTTINTLEHVVL
jgi:hypothetical protein